MGKIPRNYKFLTKDEMRKIADKDKKLGAIWWDGYYTAIKEMKKELKEFLRIREK